MPMFSFRGERAPTPGYPRVDSPRRLRPAEEASQDGSARARRRAWVAAAAANVVAAGFFTAAMVALVMAVNPLWVGLGAVAAAWLITTGLAEMSFAATRHLDRDAPPEHWPAVCALIPVYQEPGPTLRAAPESLLAQDYPRDDPDRARGRRVLPRPLHR